MVELSDYHRPKIKWGIFPVFPSNPMTVGEKCCPVYDILVGEDGKPKLAQSLYSPNKEFDREFMRLLRFIEYYPATEAGRPVPCLTRRVSYNYFYMKDCETNEGITLIPQSLWALETKLCDLGSILKKPLEIELTIDEEGCLKKYKTIDYTLKQTSNRMLRKKKGEHLFTPAMKGDEPVPCKLVLVFGTNESIPDVVFNKVFNASSKKMMLRKLNLDTDLEASVKIAYEQYGCVNNIVCENVTGLNYRQIWILLSGIRYWSQTDRDINYLDERVSLNIKAHDFPIVIGRKIIDFVPAHPIGDTDIENVITQMREDTVDEISFECFVNSDGIVEKVDIYSSQNEKLNDDIQDAAKEWEFAPSYYDGRAVPSVVRMNYTFKLTTYRIWY